MTDKPRQKRRVIYFSDEEWAELKALAKREKMTISQFLRMLVLIRAEGSDE